MRGFPLVALLAVACLVLSGCSSKSPSETSSASSSAKTSSVASVSTSAQSGNGTNHAPVITAFAVNKTAGAVPLKVAFKVNATDADKDNLTFTLGFGDKSANATGKLPIGNVTHVFAAAGNYTARLTISDGKAAVNKTLVLQVLAGVTSSLPPKELTGHLTVSDPIADAGQGCFVAIFTLLPGVPGEGGQIFDLPTGYAGGTFTSTPAGLEVDFLDSGSNTVGSGSSGAIPATAVQAMVCASDPTVANADYTVTLLSP